MWSTKFYSNFNWRKDENTQSIHKCRVIVQNNFFCEGFPLFLFREYNIWNLTQTLDSDVEPCFCPKPKKKSPKLDVATYNSIKFYKNMP